MRSKKMRNKIFFIFLMLAIIIATGCLKTYQEIRIKSDLSGELYCQMVYNIDDIVPLAALQQKILPSKITPQQRMAITEQIRGTIELMQNDEQRENIEGQLPDGVKLEDFSVDGQDPKNMKINLKLSFNHIDRVKELQDFELGQMTGDEKGQKPFADFKITKEGKKLIIEKPTELLLPTKMLPKKQEKLNKRPEEKEIQALVDNTVNGISYNFRIRLPYMKYNLIKHNADKYDQKGHTLYWFYPGRELMNCIETGKSPKSVYVLLEEK